MHPSPPPSVARSTLVLSTRCVFRTYVLFFQIFSFQQEQNDIQERLSRTYGGGDMEAFPELNIVAPDLHQDAIDGERTIDIEVSL